MGKYSAMIAPDDSGEDTPRQSYAKMVENAPSADDIQTEPPKQERSTASKVLGYEVAPFESAIKMGTGTVASAPASLYQFLSGDPENAAKIQQALTYQPRTEEGKKLSDIVESPLDPLMWPGMITHKIGEITGSPRTEAAANLALLVAGARGAKGGPAPKPTELPITPESAARLEAYPDIKQGAKEFYAKDGGINQQVLDKHLDAADVGTRLTEGQATGDPSKISAERNDPKYADVFNKQDKALVDHFSSIRDSATPAVIKGTNKEHGQDFVDDFKSADMAKRQEINDKYSAIEKANGGQNPIDPFRTINSIYDKLKEDGSLHDLSPSSKAKIEEFKNNPETMDVNGYLRLRRALSRESGTANDGTVRHAASVAVQALDDIKLKNDVSREAIDAAAAARSAARERFQLIDRNPLYKSVVQDAEHRGVGEESPLADNLVTRMINSPGAHVREVHGMLSDTGKQNATNGVLNFVEQNSIDRNGTFKRDAFSKSLAKLGDKQGYLLPPETAANLGKLERVAGYVKAAPPGNFINVSKTTPAAVEMLRRGGEGALAAKTGGLSTVAGKVLKGYKEKKEFERSTAPAAGVTKLSDVGK